jgi:hypothetical protein
MVFRLPHRFPKIPYFCAFTILIAVATIVPISARIARQDEGVAFLGDVAEIDKEVCSDINKACLNRMS